MSDIADLGAEAAEFQLSLALEKVKTTPELTIKGNCYNCDEPLPSPLRFCDSDCRDDHEKRQKLKN
jgi:hypothetical protein